MDFEKALLLLQALDDQKVDYILVGALGMTVHGIIRATQDIDLFVGEAVAPLYTAFCIRVVNRYISYLFDRLYSMEIKHLGCISFDC